MTRPRILYITGMTRCGSTMLGNVLNEVPGVMHIGELHYLWRNGVLGSGTNSSCGCGRDLRSCPVWSAVLDTAEVPDGAAGAAAIARAQDRVLRHGHTAARLAELRGGEPTADLAAPIEAMAAVYHALHRSQGTPLLVDGSKYPAEAAALLRRRDLDVRVLHMVRDPRATVASYLRSKAYIDRMSPWRVVTRWNQVNRASELLRDAAGERFLQVRHEDFGTDPRAVLDRVLRFAGSPGPNPVNDAGAVALHGNHTVTGNPDRLERGTRRISCDERWRTALGPGPRAFVARAAAPGLRRYGYGRTPAAATAGEAVMDLGLHGRAALVPAASSGLGLAVATALAREGASVSICARTAATLESAHAAVDAAGPGTVLSEVVDLRDHDAAAGWVRRSGERLGAIDVLIGNTPGVTHGWAEDFAVADYRAAVDSSLLPHVAMVLAAAPWLRRDGFGRVVLITSEAVREPAPHNVLSGVARVGVLAFARNLVHSFGDSGVTVNVLAPGYHATPALKGPGGVTDVDELARQVPLGRVGDAGDFGALAAFLASRQASFVTGALLLADGGHTAGLV